MTRNIAINNYCVLDVKTYSFIPKSKIFDHIYDESKDSNQLSNKKVYKNNLMYENKTNCLSNTSNSLNIDSRFYFLFVAISHQKKRKKIMFHNSKNKSI